MRLGRLRWRCRRHALFALTQVNRDNVSGLRIAWVFHTGEMGEGVNDWDRSAFEATPILYDGTLYFTTPSTNVVAIDAATGTLRWRHDSHNRNDLHYSDGVSRGVSLWVDETTPVSARLPRTHLCSHARQPPAGTGCPDRQALRRFR